MYALRLSMVAISKTNFRPKFWNNIAGVSVKDRL